jgi:hypothetical protein
MKYTLETKSMSAEYKNDVNQMAGDRTHANQRSYLREC